MRKRHALVMGLLGICSAMGGLPDTAPAAGRPRIVATTDGEIDDRCSMVRFLLYTDQWDIEAIIYSSSKFHWKGHNWAGEDWIERDIDLYAQCYDNLKRHAPGFPTPSELKRKVFVGNIDNVGEMEKETPGSHRIVEILLDSKPGPVYLQAWGGTNTIARALKTIQEKHPQRMAEVSRKAVLYIILDQDDTLKKYIIPNWPDLQVLGSFRQFACIAYGWKKAIPESLHPYFLGEWMKTNILSGHGPLCGRYEAHGESKDRHGTWHDGDFRSEGDSPSFMHQIDVGLRSLEHPSFGGWGGRFERDPIEPNVWRGAKDDGDVNKPIWRWAAAFQNDWAARADWCVKPVDQANHPPVVRFAHPLDMKVERGQTVRLDASGSTDPDGHSLTYKWWQYKEAGTCRAPTTIRGADRRTAPVVVRGDADKGTTIHVVCEVTDSGSPPLTRYGRVILTVQ